MEARCWDIAWQAATAQLEARRSSSGGPDYYKLMEQLDRPVDQAREEDSSDGDPLAHADGIYLSERPGPWSRDPALPSPPRI